MTESPAGGHVSPAPRRVRDGLLSAAFHRPHWIPWGFESTINLDEVRSVLAAHGVRLAACEMTDLPASVLPRDVVVICPAAKAAAIPANLEAAQLVSVGAVSSPRRGDIHVQSLQHLVGLIAGEDEIATTSTYHEI